MKGWDIRNSDYCVCVYSPSSFDNAIFPMIIVSVIVLIFWELYSHRKITTTKLATKTLKHL